MTKDEQAELTLLSMANPKGRLGIDMHTGLGDADLDAAFDRGLSSLWFTFVDLVPSKHLAGESDRKDLPANHSRVCSP